MNVLTIKQQLTSDIAISKKLIYSFWPGYGRKKTSFSSNIYELKDKTMVSVRVSGLEVVIWPTAKFMLEQGKDRASEIQQSMDNTCAVLWKILCWNQKLR